MNKLAGIESGHAAGAVVVRKIPVQVVVLTCLLLFVAGCAERGRPVIEDQARNRDPVIVVRGKNSHREARAERAASRHVYLVKHGDTLYRIAWRFGSTVEKLAELNGLRPPFTIYPGQRLRVSRTQVSEAAPSAQGSAPISSGPEQPARRPATAPTGPVGWRWPVQHPPSREFGSGNKGLDFDLPLGAVVRAAGDGVVVYSGVGLGGYESLVIIRHSGDYLSAYSLNCAVHPKEGDVLKGGDIIADISGSGRAARFHFEIRKEGDPVGPRTLLR